MLINYKKEMMHDSTMPEYRDPAGAVVAGAPVVLRFRTKLENVESVYLCLIGDGFHEDHLMRREGDAWQTEITAPSIPDVYWYYFMVRVGGRISYYGAAAGRTCGIGAVYSAPPPAYQLTVYDAGFEVPGWFQKSVMYQIFPDRFRPGRDSTARQGIAYHLAKGRRAYLHDSWDEEPLFTPLPGETAYNPCDYFGGTLKGIEASLDYLKSLGVNVLYLNPIFEAASNHRYNTADYFRVDPVLGTEEDFRSLCRAAEGRGMHILLDGVFSHTGSDSIYFNREKAYDTPGAANSPDSPYYTWYTFERYPDQYRCWWGFTSLPEINKQDPGWQRYVITGADSVVKHWLRAGAAGYRIDVADELPDDVLKKIYEAAKQTKSEAVMIGEVWEDATTKHSYGVKRRYALGGILDSVTNYPLRSAMIAFLKGQSDAFDLKHFLVDQAANYPAPLYYALTNLLSSHDVERVRTALSARIDPHQLTREQQASFVVSDSQNKKGARRQRLAAVLQFCLPGVPCVYYGDEKGMTGFLDPFNRAPFTEKAPYDLTDEYRRLAGLRASADTLQTGHVVYFAPDADCLGVLRYIIGGKDALGRPAGDGVYFMAVNRSDAHRLVVFDFAGKHSLFAEADQQSLLPLFNGTFTCLLTQKSFTFIDALFEISLPPLGAVWLKIA